MIGNLERRYRETNSEYIRERITEYMSDKPCPTCKGKRLRPEAIAVTVAGANIIEVTSWPILRTLEWINDLSGKKSALTRRQLAIAERVIKEIRSRLGFLVDVGLDYLTLNRSAGSLSGGEAQRIRLATQVGSRLVGVLYVLDEPSIGLHAARQHAPAQHAQGLARSGQHRAGRRARRRDHPRSRLDRRPRARAQASTAAASSPRAPSSPSWPTPHSLTGQYLSGSKQIPVPKHRREGNGKQSDGRRGARQQSEGPHGQYPAGQAGLHHGRVRAAASPP